MRFFVDFSLVSAAQLAVHLVEIVLIIVLPRDALLLLFGSRAARGGLVVLFFPCGDGELVRARPEHVVIQSLAAVDARAVRHDGAVCELLHAEPLRAEAALLVDEGAVGLLYVVLQIGPREAELPEEPIEAEIARIGAIWVIDVVLEALAVCREALAEIAELVGLFAVHDKVEGGLAEKALGVERAERHFCFNLLKGLALKR
jgi:hypothetical protein